MLTAVALLVSTAPPVMLSVPSAFVAKMPCALLVKMLTVPRLFVPVPPEMVTAWPVMREPEVPSVNLVKLTLPLALLMLMPVLAPLPVTPLVPLVKLMEPPVVPSTFTARCPDVPWVIDPA
jgi:hypothetical protein